MGFVILFLPTEDERPGKRIDGLSLRQSPRQSAGGRETSLNILSGHAKLVALMQHYSGRGNPNRLSV